jgi:serine/threonine protein kinase
MKFTYTSGTRPLDGYTIKRGVGHGGFGEVYYAVSDGGKEVALKLVLRNLDVELRGVAQCMNLKHPNLVTLYDLRTNDAGEQWVVMEYVAGKSLSQLLEEQPNGFTTDEVNRWLEGICAGIGYLHDKGIVHRDLKPGNLFLEDGVVKVGDYGLSKFITASRRSGQTESVGTVHYMAPEISRGKYDREIDVYATGIVLYEMLTGHVPFDGESVGEILMKHLTAQPDVSRLPPPYNQVALRALAKDPTDRFRTMDEFAASLNGRLPMSSGFASLRPTAAYVPSAEAAAGTSHEAGPAPPPRVAPAKVYSPPLSVSFSVPHRNGWAVAQGVLRFDGSELMLQFQEKDNFVGILKSALKEVRVPLHDIASLRIQPRWCSTKLILQATSVGVLANVPTETLGRLRMNIARDDRAAAARLVDAVNHALGVDVSPERAANGAKAAANAGAGEHVMGDPLIDWINGARARAIAWYDRPWTAKDYFLAVLCMVAIALAGTALMGGVVALLPGAAIVLGALLIVMKISGKKTARLAAATPQASPVMLNPMHAATPIRPSPVVPPAAPVAPAVPVPPPAPSAPPPAQVLPPRPVALRELPRKPGRTRLMEACSAMLLTTVLAAISAVIAAGAMGLSKIEECALLAATTLGGCWAVIIPGKFWEGRAGDSVLRRLVMAVLGLGVGMGAVYLDGLLQVGWLNDPKTAPRLFESLDWMPKMVMNASYFSLVFLLPRWWMLADSRRGVRFNPWSAIVPSFWAWMITLGWNKPFDLPQFWGVVATALVAVIVQVASPWDDPAVRRRAA